MDLRKIIKKLLPERILKFRYHLSYSFRLRKESNRWLHRHCQGIKGKVLSIGSANDDDGQCNHYKNYFSEAFSYTTSEVSLTSNADLILDVRSMPEINDEFYDCIFCSGVLEHVDDLPSALQEITRILKAGGVLLLGVPFRQEIHMAPNDFWRFTEHGIKHLLQKSYMIIDFEAIGKIPGKNFPATYWIKAKRLKTQANPALNEGDGD